MASLFKIYSKEKLSGQIFTPYYIVDKILDDIGYQGANIRGKSILDPACGDGRFLSKIVERVLNELPPETWPSHLENIHGWDIDALAVERAIEKLDAMVAAYSLKVDWNLKVRDSLDKKHHQEGENFDFVVGNPPYIRIQHLAEDQRKYIKEHYSFCQNGSTDIYIAFYELALKLLSPKGQAAFITPNTFFHTQTAQNLRQYFEEQQNLHQVSNYGSIQLFEDATTYSTIVVFGLKKRKEFLLQTAQDKHSFQERSLDFSEIKGQSFWQLSPHKIGQAKGKKLGDIAKIHVGISTLADKMYIMPAVKEEADYLHLKTNTGAIIKIERGILKPIIKASTLKKASQVTEKYVIFPYHKGKGKPQIIPEETLAELYPQAYQYLSSIKKQLERRDNGRPNPVAWYAFGRSQGLETSFGKKILFSPMNKKPNFIYDEQQERTFYSGYCIKYQGDVAWLLKQLNSRRMEEFIQISSRDFRGGWKAYNKKIVQEFRIHFQD